MTLSKYININKYILVLVLKIEDFVFKKEDLFEEIKNVFMNEIHIRILLRGRNKITIIQGLDKYENINMKKLLSAFNKAFHCSGGIVDDLIYGKIIKLTGDQKDKAYDFIILNEIADTMSVKKHGI